MDLVDFGIWWILGFGGFWDLVDVGIWWILGFGGFWDLVDFGVWWILGFGGFYDLVNTLGAGGLTNYRLWDLNVVKMHTFQNSIENFVIEIARHVWMVWGTFESKIFTIKFVNSFSAHIIRIWWINKVSVMAFKCRQHPHISIENFVIETARHVWMI